MAYLTIEDFRFGMDRRRERVAGTPGTLWLGKNVHVTRGGDIERRKKFVSQYTVAGTFGCAALRSQLYVFGSADLASTMPNGVQYQRLQAPSAAAMTKLLDVKSFRGSLYAIAEYADGSVHHFYNGVRVADWDVIAAAAADFTTVAEALAEKIGSDSDVSVIAFGNALTLTAKVPGTPFTVAKSTVNGGSTADQDITLAVVQANVAAVDEVRATVSISVTGGSTSPSSNTISSIKLDGVQLLSTAVDWSASNASTAIKLAAAISNGYTTHGYSAEASGSTVTISAAPGTGSTPNGKELVVTTTGDVTFDAGASLAGGVTAISAIAQVHRAQFGGTFEAADGFTITINGTDYKTTGLASATGRTAFVGHQRIWSPVGSLERYCMLNQGDVWDPARTTFPSGGSIPAQANDAGFLNVASETEGNEKLVIAARYQGFTAIFSQSLVTLYQLDVDPANFQFSNSLENTGTIAPLSVIRYGNNDVFYLDLTGIRSLRARDSSNAPFVSDIGNAIDTFIQDYVATLTNEQIRAAVAAIEPRDGRQWLSLGGRIFVLSYFPGAKISAWSYYEPEELAGAAVQNIVRIGRQLYIRAGDDIFVYGGVDGATYPEDDEITGEVQLPFMSGKTPATIKELTGFDIAATNTWECVIAFDPNAEDKTINCGRLSRITFADAEKIKIPGRTSMIAPTLTCTKGGRATISMMAIHYEGEPDPG